MSRNLLLIAVVVVLAQAVKAEPAMWVIRDTDSTIYLIGTMHLLKHDADWNTAKVKKTVHESTELWLELVDADNQATLAPLMAKYGVDPTHPLSTKLSGEQRKRLEKSAATYGIPTATLEQLQPWLAAVVLAIGPIAKAGYDRKAGVEQILSAQATAEGDKIRGLETAEEQFRIFADLSEKEQVEFLMGILDDLDKGIELLDQLAKARMDGDVDTIARLSVDEMKRESPAVYKKVIVQRNIRWSEKIAEMLKGSGVQQIAVGAAHLAGPDSVQAQLAKRGIKVERY